MEGVPAIGRDTWRELGSLTLPLVVGLAALILFAVLDGRPPDDHDVFYTDRVLEALPRVSTTTGWARVEALVGFCGQSTLYPRLATTWLLALLAEVGPGQTAYRLANAPFLASLILGCWLLGRAVGDRTTALLAALLAPAMPVLVNESRKWDLQFHATSLLLLGSGLLVWVLRTRGARGTMLGIAAGVTLAGSAYCHPITLPVAGLVLVMFLGGHLAFARHHRLPGTLRGLVVVGVGTWVAAPLSRLPPLGPEPAWSFPSYLAARSMWVPKSSDVGQMAFLWSKHADQYLQELRWLLFPSMALLALAGLLALPWAVSRSDPAARAVGVSLWGLTMAGLVGGFWIVARTAYLSDMMFTFAFLGVGLVWTLERATVGWSRSLWRAAAGSHVVGVLGLPVVLPATPLAPESVPWAYADGPLRLLRSSPSGDLTLTHFVPLDGGLGGRSLAAQIGAFEREEPPRVAHVELTWTGSQMPGCGPVEGDSRWRFGPPQGAARGSGRQLAWRLAFAGAGRVIWVEPPDEVLPRGEFTRPPDHGPLKERIDGDDGPDIVVFRLWSREPAVPKQLECSVVGPGLLADASTFIEGFLPDHEVRAVRDLPAELLGIDDYRTRNAHYLHGAILATEGTAVVTP